MSLVALCRRARRGRSERGAALLIALMAVALLSALGIALVVVTTTEVLIAGNYRTAQEGFYAADAALERALRELSEMEDWNAISSGGAASAFTDGAPGGVRTLSDGSILDLVRATNLLNCGRPAACSTSDAERVTEERPWGAHNPRWRLYAHAPLSAFLPARRIDSPFYVIVWVADDPRTNAGVDPDLLMVRAEARGPAGARRTVEASVGRRTHDAGESDKTAAAEREPTDETTVRPSDRALDVSHGTLDTSRKSPARMRVLSWREVR